ncbi:DUF3043 domain-containing protein [Rothia sp. ZJ932]|uniref:DUF3043 domain-containing protein n=1 Tax=Rothia sp. ZJ932 TaxID=2810516 RepID=UPI001966FD57|nr:DUF3043 domain-containing protein [Rothia sp. ZJ932]QRZ60730.1 DUF3043 domain-containing protein [Rothia sp. ZJ932]
MLGRNKKNEKSPATHGSVATSTAATDNGEQQAVTENSKKTTPPKGRPTPSRKQQQAARKQPLVPDDRKAAKEAQRQQAREHRLREQEALRTGEERYLPLRDRGPQRRFIRDYVDARWNVGDFVIIALLIFFLVSLFLGQYQLETTIIMWGLILLWAFDTWLVWRKIKARLVEKFGDVEPGSAMYTMNRVLMIRRMRLPKPQVARGQYPK